MNCRTATVFSSWLGAPGSRGGYVQTGYWSRRAMNEGAVHLVVQALDRPEQGGQVDTPEDLDRVTKLHEAILPEL